MKYLPGISTALVAGIMAGLLAPAAWSGSVAIVTFNAVWLLWRIEEAIDRVADTVQRVHNVLA